MGVIFRRSLPIACLVAIAMQGALFAQTPTPRSEASPTPSPGTGTTVERTVTIGHCAITASFRVQLLNPQHPDAPLDDVYFAKAKPEIHVTNNASLGIQVNVTKVSPFGGSLSFAFARTAPGTTQPAPPGPFSAPNATDTIATLKNAMQGVPQVIVPAPAGITAGQSLVETITASATWTSNVANVPPCAISEDVRIVWDYANPGASIKWAPPGAPAGKSGVVSGTTLEPVGPRYTAALEAYYHVDDVRKCCARVQDYAVIQFVRHLVKINETPAKESTNNSWSLDVLDSQIANANASPPQPYDPTFTHDPLGTAPTAPPLVYPGPDGSDKLAITQLDQPGFAANLYDRLARAGGSFTWNFLALLVCKLPGNANATAYLQNGEVAATLAYTVVVEFPGGGKAPTVSTPEANIHFEFFKKCKELRASLAELTRKSQNGSFQRAYEHPAPHQVQIP